MVPVPTVEPLTAENMLWSNTVLAAGSAVGFVVYTGSETRAVMNTSHPETKVGLLDSEINNLAKVGSFFASPKHSPQSDISQILCAVTLALSVVLVALNGFRGLWYIYILRFLIVFSSIIPIRYVFTTTQSEFSTNQNYLLVCASTWIWARRSMRIIS